jgi:hypothetical protein
VRRSTARPRRTGQRQPTFKAGRQRTQTRSNPWQPRALRAPRSLHPGKLTRSRIGHVRYSTGKTRRAGLRDPTLKLEQPPIQSRVGRRLPQTRRASIRATGQVLAAAGGSAGKVPRKDSDNSAPAGKTRGLEPRRKARAGRRPSHTGPGTGDKQPVSAGGPVQEKLNRASPGRARRHGGSRSRHARAVGPARLGTARYDSIQNKFSQSSSRLRASVTPERDPPRHTRRGRNIVHS